MLAVWRMVGVWGLTVPSPHLRDHLPCQELPFPWGGACQGSAVPAGSGGRSLSPRAAGQWEVGVPGTGTWGLLCPPLLCTLPNTCS